MKFSVNFSKKNPVFILALKGYSTILNSHFSEYSKNSPSKNILINEYKIIDNFSRQKHQNTDYHNMQAIKNLQIRNDKYFVCIK